MSAILENELGKITFTDDYIGNIAGISAMECYGVVGMTSKTTMQSINELLKKEDYKKGVIVTSNSSTSVSLQLHIVVEYGTSISEIGKSIIGTVKYNIENATGLTVDNIEVVVSGIRVTV